MNNLFKEAIYNNRWLWFHILLGGLLCKIFLIFLLPQKAILLVIILSILYEIYQWIANIHRNFLDSIGDIMGAFLMAVIVGL